ncbi:MAG: toll/interleukin-1 receptor domain-containing protein [Anaerolineae bacterium]|nr:toll/interleukin-1 receptor domain-containing protein [Anaerolineae bacterium]
MLNLEEYLEMVCARPLPANPMAQVRTLARELAEGASHGQWSPKLRLYKGMRNDILEIRTENVRRYISERWQISPIEKYREQNVFPNQARVLFELLFAINFLREPADNRSLIFEIEQRSFDLLEERDPETIFISYRRSESSAIALLTLRYLKLHNLEAFLDLAIDPGENWHASLEEKIEFCDFMVLILGKTTLSSMNVCKEILWALTKEKDVIPIRQPDFDFDCIEWPSDLPAVSREEISKKVNLTNAIRVIEESALEYHKAMTALLNRFGITP